MFTNSLRYNSHMCACACVRICVCVYMLTGASVGLHVHVYMCVCIYMSVCAYACARKSISMHTCGYSLVCACLKKAQELSLSVCQVLEPIVTMLCIWTSELIRVTFLCVNYFSYKDISRWLLVLKTVIALLSIWIYSVQLNYDVEVASLF